MESQTLAFECEKNNSHVEIIKTYWSDKSSVNFLDDFVEIDEEHTVAEIVAKYKDNSNAIPVVFEYDLMAPTEVYQMIFFNPDPEIKDLINTKQKISFGDGHFWGNYSWASEISPSDWAAMKLI
jgi:hypothetical protein